MAELFGTSKQSISRHIVNILKERELNTNSVVKHYLTAASGGKQYDVVFYSLEMNEVVFLSTKVVVFLQIDNCMVHLIAGRANNHGISI